MSKEKQIEEMACETCQHYFACLVNAEYVPSPCKAYKRKQVEQEWISVDERLPEESGYYLTYHNGVTSALEYSVRHKLFNAADDLPEAFSKEHSIMVSHWMPLPEPPKMKGGAE